MNHGTTCQFCKKPITIEIADDYTQDVHKLIPLAACDKCADLRVERRTLEARIGRACVALRMLAKSEMKERESIRTALDKLTQKYANLIARWHGMDGSAWDEECVSLLMDKPDHWPEIISGLWKLFRQTTQNTPRTS